MQAYFFPYLGYFQLMQAVDTFVSYDDVQFTRRGYIHRNSLLLHGRRHAFTLPVPKGSNRKLLHEVILHDDTYIAWRDSWLETLRHAYAKAPYYVDVIDMIADATADTRDQLAEYNLRSLRATCEYIGIEVDIVSSLDLDYDRSGDRVARLAAICDSLGADKYVNAPGGRQLYAAADFAVYDIKLAFLQPRSPAYEQGTVSHEPDLSIIDVMMWCDRSAIHTLLDQYSIDEQN